MTANKLIMVKKGVSNAKKNKGLNATVEGKDDIK